MNIRNVLLGFGFLGVVCTSVIAAPGSSYCNEKFDPIVGQYLSSPVTTGVIPGQMNIHADGSGLYDDSTHHGHKVQWDSRVDGPVGIVSSDGYMQWKKTSGMDYKILVTFLLGYPSVVGKGGVFPTDGFIRYIAVGTATRSNDCSTLTATFCSFIFSPDIAVIDPNNLSCEGQETGTQIFHKVPNL